MSNPRWGENWRGHPWSRWESILKRPNIKGLLEILERYAPGTVEPTSKRQSKQAMTELAMAAMDNHVPRLSNEQVDKIFKRPSRTGNPIDPPTHPNTENATGVPNQGSVAPAPSTINPGIESRQLPGLTSAPRAFAPNQKIIARQGGRIEYGPSAPTVRSERVPRQTSGAASGSSGPAIRSENEPRQTSKAAFDFSAPKVGSNNGFRQTFQAASDSSASSVESDHGTRETSRAVSGFSTPAVGSEHGPRQTSWAASGPSAPLVNPGHLPRQTYPIEPGTSPSAISPGNTSGPSLGASSASRSSAINIRGLARDVLNYVTIPRLGGFSKKGSLQPPGLSSVPQASDVNPENTPRQVSETEIEDATPPAAGNSSPPPTVNLENTPRQVPEIEIEYATPPAAGNSSPPPPVNLENTPLQLPEIQVESATPPSASNSFAPPTVNLGNIPPQVLENLSVPPRGINRERRSRQLPGLPFVPQASALNSENAPGQVPGIVSVPPAAVIVPGNLITSDQFHLSYIEEARRAIRDFLRATYYQSWQLEANFHPYLPIQPIFGGHTIDSDAKLQSLLGRVGNPHISSLRVGIYTKLNGGQKILKFTKMGSLLPCRGRGPFWQQNSCALDCVIVAARLLNLGITVADRGDATRGEWLKNLPPLERNFMGLIGIPWEGISDADSIVARHRFLPKFLDKFNNPNAPRQTRIGDFLSAIAIWGLCTSGMGQLKFSAQTHTLCSKCDRSLPEGTPSPSINHDIALPQMNAETRRILGDKPSMSELLNLHFGIREKDCRNCKSLGTQSGWSVVYGDLPTRLVVLPDASYRDVVGATSRRIAINHQEPGGILSTAVYRWIGGIYQHGNHYRVYWTDCKPNEDSNNYMVYDGMMLGGSLWGGNVPNDAEARIPSTWSQGADILFYERTEPSATTLQYAANAVNEEIVGFFRDLLETSGPDPLQAGNRGKKRKRSVEESTASESETLQDEFGIAATMAKYRKRI